MEVSTSGYPFIVAHKPPMGLTGSHGLPLEVAVRPLVGHPLTALQCNRPKLGNSLPPIPVEAFPSRGPLDADCLFQQEFLRSPGLVDHRCDLPVDGMVTSPGVLRNRRLLHRLGSACILVLPQPGFQPPLGLATASGNPVHHVGLLLHRQSILLGQH